MNPRFAWLRELISFGATGSWLGFAISHGTPLQLAGAIIVNTVFWLSLAYDAGREKVA
jgi:hypothetical protein